MKSIKQLLPLLFFTLILTFPLFSMDLTVEDAIELATNSNLSLQNAQLDIQDSINKDKEDYFALMPAVSVGGSLRRSNTGVTTFALPSMTTVTLDPTVNLALSISFSYNFNPALVTSLKIAPINTNISKLEKEKLIKETETNVKKLFYAILFQQETLKIQNGTLQSYLDRYNQAKEKYETGFAMELDVLKAQVSYENKKSELSKQQDSIDQQLLTFNYILGLDLTTPIKLIGNLEYTTLSSATASSNTPQLLQLTQQQELLKINKTMLKQQLYVPSVSLSASYQPFLGDITQSWKADNWSDAGSISVSVGFNLTNLLPGSDANKNLKALQLNEQKLNNSIKMLKDSNELTIQKAISSLNSIQTALDQSNYTIELAQTSLNTSKELYKNGYLELLDLKEAENQYELALLAQLSEKFNYISTLIDLEAVTGTKLI